MTALICPGCGRECAKGELIKNVEGRVVDYYCPDCQTWVTGERR